MRPALAILLVLGTVGWLASQIPAMPDDRQPPTPIWRRTSDGWERAERIWASMTVSPPVLHPAIVGLAQLCFALAALIGLGREDRKALRPTLRLQVFDGLPNDGSGQ